MVVKATKHDLNFEVSADFIRSPARRHNVINTGTTVRKLWIGRDDVIPDDRVLVIVHDQGTTLVIHAGMLLLVVVIVAVHGVLLHVVLL